MKEMLLAAGGVVGAVAASGCCIVPLTLVSVGVSGAWIGHLTALAPYHLLFIAFAAVCLGAGFWLVYRPTAKACEVNSNAGSALRRTFRNVLWVKAALWVGAALVALSAGVDAGSLLFL